MSQAHRNAQRPSETPEYASTKLNFVEVESVDMKLFNILLFSI